MLLILTSDPNRPSGPVASIRFHSHQIACKPTRLFASGCQIGQLQSIYIVERSLARDAEIIAAHGGSSPFFRRGPTVSIPGSLMELTGIYVVFSIPRRLGGPVSRKSNTSDKNYCPRRLQLFSCRVSSFAQTPTVNGCWMKTSGALLHPRMKRVESSPQSPGILTIRGFPLSTPREFITLVSGSGRRQSA
jgi:hypothetical protein